MRLGFLALLVALFVLAGCGGSEEITCDDGPYLSAVTSPRLKTPEGLDDLEEYKELPLPQASPREERPADAPCLDRPPLDLGDR